MIFESVWEYEKLWNKAKIYMQKAFAEERDGSAFPLWATIGLELTARATLAKVHPVLLADPREGEHLMYVFGYQKKPNYIPISIPTKTVFERCETIVPNFTSTEKSFCQEITTRRNEELHSGNLGFDNYQTNKWLTKFYRTLNILLDFQGKKLDELLNAEEAEAAKEMIAERAANLEKVVRDRISQHKKSYKRLPKEEKKEKLHSAQRKKWSILQFYRKEEKCPSCGNQGVITGKLISISAGKAGEAEIFQNFNVLPTAFRCFNCDLTLENHLELDAIEIGGQYRIEETFEPNEYFEIPTYEPDFDYGND